MADDDARIRIREVRVLSDNWATLKKTVYDFRRRDGTWLTQDHETYDRGDGVVILLYNSARGTVVLIRQFRLPAYVNGVPDGLLVEACAGKLDQADPEAEIRRETEEETGYRLRSVTKAFALYSTPGSVTEKLHYFVAEYDPASRRSTGGGEHDEDIEVIELPFARALAMVDSGEIRDAKTVILLQYAQLKGLLSVPPA